MKSVDSDISEHGLELLKINSSIISALPSRKRNLHNCAQMFPFVLFVDKQAPGSKSEAAQYHRIPFCVLYRILSSQALNPPPDPVMHYNLLCPVLHCRIRCMFCGDRRGNANDDHDGGDDDDDDDKDHDDEDSALGVVLSCLVL